MNSIKEWSCSPFIGDDCAILPNGQLLTTDTLVEGTHFLLPQISLSELGWKSIAVNLSDIAAMAGRPRYVLISITVPTGFKRSDFETLYQGMVACCRAYGAVIAGGDLTKGDSLSITITVQGDVHENGCLTRSKAKTGDVVAVTGTLGASAAGLWLLLNEGERRPEFPLCYTAHVHPLPRLCESWALVRRSAGEGALMDTSDGLADALVQIGRASGKGLLIDLEKLPIDAQTVAVSSIAGTDPLDWALYGGEDYELVACIPQVIWHDWSVDNPFKMIGSVNDSGKIELLNGEMTRELNLSKCFEQLNF